MQDVLYPNEQAHQPTIGVDVSKASLDIAGLGKPTRVPNTVAGCRRLAKRLAKMTPRVVAVEATGGYERQLVQALWDHQAPVAVLQPSRVRAHAKAAGQLAKTDTIDADMIKGFAASRKVRLAQRPSAEAETLRVLADRRDQIVQDRVRETGRLEAVRDRTMRAEIKRHIAHLEKLEASLDDRMAKLIDRTVSLRSRNAVLRKNRGIGPVVASTLLSHLPELGTVGRQVIGALGGMAPFANESGNWRGKRRIFGGRAQVRRALYLATLAAVRHPGPMQTRYRALLDRGKPKKVALIACARKMLVALNSQMAQHLADEKASLAQIVT